MRRQRTERGAHLRPLPEDTPPGYWGLIHTYPAETAPRMCREVGCPLAAECLLHADSGTQATPETIYPGFGRSGTQCGWYIPANYRGSQVYVPEEDRARLRNPLP